jgi:hypothetical protein
VSGADLLAEQSLDHVSFELELRRDGGECQ